MSLWTTSAGLTSRRVRANPSIQLPGSSTVLRGAKPFRVPAKRGAVPRHTRKAATCSVHRHAPPDLGRDVTASWDLPALGSHPHPPGGMRRSAKVIMGDGLEQRFEIKRVLGQGGFGIVHEVVSRNNNNTYAIKTMRLPRNLSAQEKQQAEIDVLTRVGRCLNICTLYEVFKTPGHLHMVMEACTGGTLASRLADESDGHYSEVRRRPAHLAASGWRWVRWAEGQPPRPQLTGEWHFAGARGGADARHPAHSGAVPQVQRCASRHQTGELFVPPRGRGRASESDRLRPRRLCAPRHGGAPGCPVYCWACTSHDGVPDKRQIPLRSRLCGGRC